MLKAKKKKNEFSFYQNREKKNICLEFFKSVYMANGKTV